MCPLSVVLPSDEAQAEVSQGGGPMPSAAKRPLSPARLTQIQRADSDDTVKQAVDSYSLYVDCRAVHSSCDLQAGFDRVATCAVCLSLTGEETP